MLNMLVLITILKLVEIEGLVEIDAILEILERLCFMGFVVGFAMSFSISAKSITQTVDLFLKSLRIAFTKSHSSITTYLISEESDVAVAVVISIIPEEGVVRLDVPELSAGAVGHVFEGMEMESVRLERMGVGIHEATAL